MENKIKFKNWQRWQRVVYLIYMENTKENYENNFNTKDLIKLFEKYRLQETEIGNWWLEKELSENNSEKNEDSHWVSSIMGNDKSSNLKKGKNKFIHKGYALWSINIKNNDVIEFISFLEKREKETNSDNEIYKLENINKLYKTYNNQINNDIEIVFEEILNNKEEKIVKFYKRNKTVKNNYIKQLSEKTKCEFCKKETFQQPNNSFFLEIHHINFLSEGGEDKESNLIALCPNCHREAHLGKNKNIMKKIFLEKNNKLF